jgi:hypothetical protein
VYDARAMNPYVRKNQELWDEWTEINVRSAFYDVDGGLDRAVDAEVRTARAMRAAVVAGQEASEPYRVRRESSPAR